LPLGEELDGGDAVQRLDVWNRERDRHGRTPRRPSPIELPEITGAEKRTGVEAELMADCDPHADLAERAPVVRKPLTLRNDRIERGAAVADGIESKAREARGRQIRQPAWRSHKGVGREKASRLDADAPHDDRRARQLEAFDGDRIGMQLVNAIPCRQRADAIAGHESARGQETPRVVMRGIATRRRVARVHSRACHRCVHPYRRRPRNDHHRPASRSIPRAKKLVARQDAMRRHCRVVEDHSVRREAGDDDVVVPVRTNFNQGHDRPAELERPFDPVEVPWAIGRPVDCDPAATPHRFEEW
jgi:hypothetical protein